jgi:hypothetical protein
VALAVVVGVGLRFLQLPEFMMPILVGVGVGAAVGILAQRMMVQDEKKPQPQPAPPTGPGRLSRVTRRPAAPARGVSEN